MLLKYDIISSQYLYFVNNRPKHGNSDSDGNSEIDEDV